MPDVFDQVGQHTDVFDQVLPPAAGPHVQMEESHLAHALNPTDAVSTPGEANFVAENKDPAVRAGMLGEAAIGVSPAISSAISPIARFGSKLIKAHPIMSTLALQAAQELPYVGKYARKIPSWLPLLVGGKEGAAEGAAAEAGEATAAETAAPRIPSPSAQATPRQLGSGAIEGEYIPSPAAERAPAPYRRGPGEIPAEDLNAPDESVLAGRKGIRVAKAGPQKLLPPAPESHSPSESIPRTLSGEAALRQVLPGNNADLLKIARARGINVTKEMQLKPGVADRILVDKIVADYSPEELAEIRDQYLENTRFKHEFGDIGQEAHNTLAKKTYFPDLKIPAAAEKRTQVAIAKAKPKASAKAVSVPKTGDEDLTPILEQSLKQAKARKATTP